MLEVTWLSNTCICILVDCNLANKEYVLILEFEGGQQKGEQTLTEEQLPIIEDLPSDLTQGGKL